MDPEQHEKTPSELPTPNYKLDLSPGPADSHSETASSLNIERGVGVGGPTAAAAVVHAQDPHSSTGTPTTTAIQAHATNLPQIADDSDLIEKEWVAKAKQIVEQTKHDPRAQNTEMSVVKASYIKKRFNKDVKVNESK